MRGHDRIHDRTLARLSPKMTTWFSFLLLLVAAVFGYNVALGWRTQEVRLPIAAIVFQEFEREKSPVNFWAIMAFNVVISALALGAACWTLWDIAHYTEKPVLTLRTLDACYEGEGLPDFMRPPYHWTMRIVDGAVMGREGAKIAQIKLGRSTGSRTIVHFRPGVLIGGKPETVLGGTTTSGEAYVADGHVTIAMHDDWPNIMTETSCQQRCRDQAASATAHCLAKTGQSALHPSAP